MQALLIGIDPPEKIRKEIYRLKNKVIDSCGYQQQINEPPHCTFVVNNFTDIDSVSDVLENISGDFSTFDLNVQNIRYFPPKQSETWMVYAAIKKNKTLQELQRRVVVETSKYRKGCLLCDYLKKHISKHQYTDEETRNIKRFGFLYVGTNWQPHISIAILDEEAFRKIGEEIIKTDFRYTFKLKKMTLFTYKDKWVPYKTYKLSK